MARRLISMLKLCLFLVLLLSVSHAQQAAGAPPVIISIDRAHPEGESHLQLGVTHTQHSLDTGGDAGSIERGKALLEQVARFHNVHIMGWGTMNPSPAPGVYDWESLDRRMALVRLIPNSIPVITLCGAPDWMKGGQPGQTDWSRLEAAPLEKHFHDFALLSAQIARRYPECRYFQVWNEMKGLWNAKLNNWNYEAYTRLYNEVFDALKAVSPQIKVGGPYLVIEGTGSGKEGQAVQNPLSQRDRTVIEYWLAHKHGADFITLDRSVVSFHDHNAYSTAEKAALTRWFEAIAQQVRAMTDLPLWWAEYYAETDAGPEVVAALHASVLLHMVRGGASTALLWQPMATGEVSHALFSDARLPNGAQPLPYFAVFQIFHDFFGPGTKYFAATSSSPTVEVLASQHKTLLINTGREPLEVELGGKRHALAAHQVLAVDAPPSPLSVE